MIHQHDLSSQLASIDREMTAFKTSQPFFDGQLGMKLISNATDYDVAATFNSGFVHLNAEFVSDKQTNPFCRIFAEPYIGSMSNKATIQTMAIDIEHRATVNNNHYVGYYFQYQAMPFLGSIANGTTTYFKLYALASDTGTLSGYSI